LKKKQEKREGKSNLEDFTRYKDYTEISDQNNAAFSFKSGQKDYM